MDSLAGWLTVADVAKRLYLSPSAVYQLAALGKIAHAKMGASQGRLRFTEADVAAYVERCHVPVQEEPPATPPTRKQRRGRHPSVRLDGKPPRHFGGERFPGTYRER